jgi:hypothetical protein
MVRVLGGGPRRVRTTRADDQAEHEAGEGVEEL